MYEAPFRDGLGEVQSRREWSLYRRLDTGLGGCFERACYLLPLRAEGDDGFRNILELNPVALRWRRESESQLPPDRRSDEELKSSLRKGNLGERRKAFLQEILRRRDEAKAAGRSRMYLWLAAVIGVFSVGIAALTRRK